jgi:putative oxidoreductase
MMNRLGDTLLVYRLVFAAVWVWAGLSKLLERSDLESFLRDRLGFRAAASRAVTLILPPAEIVLGILLGWGLQLPLTSGLACLFLLIFTLALVRARWLGHLWLHCGCFGSAGGFGERRTIDLIFRNVLLLVAAVLLWGGASLSLQAASTLSRDRTWGAGLTATALLLVLSLLRGILRVRALRKAFMVPEEV